MGPAGKDSPYLYWKNGLLFQLPLSFLVDRGEWANSPGYVDGEVNFGRLISPRCLECHATSFKIEGTPPEIRYSRDYELGLSCQKCHGDGSRHVEYHAAHPGETNGKYVLNPAWFSRERKLDNCALCHSGMRELKQPSFSYKPGERLEELLMLETSPTPDVHGNQVGLLEQSKCFRSSSAMSCSTCHNVHQQERDLTQLARRCLQCHQVNQCKEAAKTAVHLFEKCLDCLCPIKSLAPISHSLAEEE